MMRNGLARGLLAILLLPGISHALGLGDVHLNSPLNAPLDAEIELVNATPEDLATLDAKLASKETFARYGLDWPPFMASVTVTRDRAANGAQVLRVRSNETVTEPFLTLLIEATWARGRLVREYTVLLDPPVFAPNAVAQAPVPAPSVGAGEATGQIERAVPQQQAPAPETQQYASLGGGDSYEVRRGDSLSAIARRLSAGTGVSTEQLMVGLFRNNSSAFEGDMNRLRAGAVLRIPASGELAAVSPSEARDEVRRAAGSWVASAGAAGTGRLRLVPPSDSASAGSGTDNSAEVTALQDRVRELEGQLNESKRMLELRNTELADLQAKLAASQQAAQQTAPATPEPTPEPAPETAAPESPEATTPEATPEAVAPTTEPAATPEPAAEKPAKPKKAPKADTVEEPGLLDTLMGYWQWILGGVAVIALLLLFAKSRGKRKSAEFDDRLGRLAEQGGDRLSEPVDSLSDTGRMRAPMAASAVPDDILVEESGTHRALQETQDIPLSAPSVRTDETISSETAVNLDQGDPLAEADFHMAYGLYDQAADLVRIAIQREPQRRDLKLKLLEVVFVWGNTEQFLATARELSESRGGSEAGEWEKIVIMGKQIAPEDPMFAEGGAAGAVGVDLNLDAGGAGRVDFDPFDVSSRLDVTGGGTPDAVDLDLGSALRDPDATGEGLQLPDRDSSGQTTREMTVKMTPAGSEAPTVEQPALRPLDEPTIREKVEGAMRRKLSSDQTAELALDDLGLELGSLEQTDSSLGLKPVDAPSHGPDSNAPTMVAGLDENSQRLLRAAAARQAGNGNADDSQLTEHGASGTWFLTERELGGDVDLTKGRSIDPGATASMKFDMPEEGYDVSSTSRLAAIDRNNLDFPVEPTREQPAMGGARGVDLDLGGGNIQMPGNATEELAVPDLEPVTLSEVGTKLDLARAYVDMGDPDGARNILNEVLSEGSASQKQEAQRLLESLPG
ncbi:MAG TPA: FimV/HubP family polar landmark protein [Steroidobacteraceae bacterium]|nr:FimV/HubP family polar landmark protein [Steroidobacteraceae bacterium]